MVASINPIQLKPSVFDYSTADIVELEKVRKTIKETLKAAEGSEGKKYKEDANYKEFKAQLKSIREVNFPFRTYAAWKRTKNHFTASVGMQSTEDRSLLLRTKESRAKIKAELLAQATSSPEMENKLRLLSRLTFIHGSNSATLAMMALSGQEPQLQCSGELMAKGIVPMSGELRIGVDVARGGVNLQSISVETVRAVERVLGYARQFSLDPSIFNSFQNPFALLFNRGPHEVVAKLQTWRSEDRDGFDALLAPGRPRTLQLIEASLQAIECAETLPEDYGQIGMLKQLIGMLRGEQEWVAQFGHSDYAGLKQTVINPYQSQMMSGEDQWSDIALRVKQLKQWNFSAFERNVLRFSDQWMQAIGQEKQVREKPLKMLIAVIDHKFTAEEEAFLKAYLTTDHSTVGAMPDSLLAVFPSLEDIPCYPSEPGFSENVVRREIGYYRRGHRSWEELLNRILVAKLQLAEGKYEEYAKYFNSAHNTQEHLDKLKPIFENQLPIIERSYDQVRETLTSAVPPQIQIPSDEGFRLLITKPFPIIFASTIVKPKPSDLGPQVHPSEYHLNQAVPLGKEGCDILFTDTEESKEKIYRFMPQLQGRVDVRLTADLDVQGFPLCTALSQIVS